MSKYLKRMKRAIKDCNKLMFDSSKACIPTSSGTIFKMGAFGYSSYDPNMQGGGKIYQLDEYVSPGGATRQPIGLAYHTAKEIALYLQGYFDGVKKCKQSVVRAEGTVCAANVGEP